MPCKTFFPDNSCDMVYCQELLLICVTNATYFNLGLFLAYFLCRKIFQLSHELTISIISRNCSNSMPVYSKICCADRIPNNRMPQTGCLSGCWIVFITPNRCFHFVAGITGPLLSLGHAGTNYICRCGGYAVFYQQASTRPGTDPGPRTRGMGRSLSKDSTRHSNPVRSQHHYLHTRGRYPSPSPFRPLV